MTMDTLDEGTNNENQKHCWVCLEYEEEDPRAEWVQPCKCRGTNKWVHQCCLQRWIDERQRGNMANKVACPLCNTDYILVFPGLGPLAFILDYADRLFFKACPYLVASLVIGAVYWTAVTYGALTVMQFLGHGEGLEVMKKTDPLFLFVSLPTIPVLLILGKMIHWEEFVVLLIHRYWSSIPLLNHLFSSSSASASGQSGEPAPRNSPLPHHTSFLNDPISTTRTLCGALALPTFATMVGKICFPSINSNLHRSILGGVTFVTIKGIFKIYLRNKQLYRQMHRRILDFREPSVRTLAIEFEE